MNLQAISLWQPWASLIAHGYKYQETRSWPPPSYIDGARIAIHATKRKVRQNYFNEYERMLLDQALGRNWWQKIPYGAIVATVRLDRSWQIDRPSKIPPPPGDHDTGPERLNRIFGDFDLDRWIWNLSDVHRMEDAIPLRGRQGFFDTGIEGEGITVGIPGGQQGQLKPMKQNRIDRLRGLGEIRRRNFKMQAKFIEKKAGYMAASDFLENRERERVYTIENVEGPERHPEIPKKKLFLRFRHSDEFLIVNKTMERTLVAAYDQMWRGQTIRITPVETIWDMEPVWGLKITPLWICENCKAGWSEDKDGKLCVFCIVAQPASPKRTPARGVSNEPLTWGIL